jgi:hypothetical protein
MPKMPNFDDMPPVPRGWAVESDDAPTTPEPTETPEDAENTVPASEDELPKPTFAKPPKKRSWVDDSDEELPAVRSTNLPKKRSSWAMDDFDDEPAPVVQEDDEEALTDEDWEGMVEAQKRVEQNHADVAALRAKEVREREVTAKQTQQRIADFTGEDAPAPTVVLKPRPVVVPATPLSQRAMLVSLNISQWSGRRFDRKVSDEVNNQKMASNKAGRYNKVLLPDCEPLAEVHRQTSSLRNWFVEQTLPWLNDGARIMPSARYLPFNAEYRAKKALWQGAVDTLVAEYPALKAKAPSQLKSMHDPADYPYQWELAGKFGMEIRVLPLPDKSDFRIDLDPATMQAIKDSMVDQEADLARTVVTDCWTRLHKVVAAMADRLGDPDAVFRNSLTENLNEVVSVLRDLNITGDKDLEAVRLDVATSLANYAPDDLRNNLGDRKAAAVKAKQVAADISAKMSALMGQPTP